MKEVNKRCSEIIDYFAESCERMNEYSRTLDRKKLYRQVTAGANIRRFLSGWKLEKYVEAELSSAEGLWACWWLELGYEEGQWHVSTSVSISHSDTDIELMDSKVNTPEELRSCLNAALDELEAALEQNTAFRDAVKAAIADPKNHSFP